MRSLRWLAVLAIAAFPLSAFSQEKPASSAKSGSKPQTQAKSSPAAEAAAKPKLGIGDAAPALKVTKWLQGGEVKNFAAGQVYVVEFWATWCGPCIASMPHLTDLQAEYRDKGLTIIGLTSATLRNTAEEVDKFMEERGSKFDYAFAFSEDGDTVDSYLRAANRNGIPCSFVVDKSGKIAYIGHPMSLDDVLPKVLDGTWKGQEDVDALVAIDQELAEILAKGENDADEALKELAAFEAKYPAKAKQTMFTARKMMLLSEAGKFDEIVALSGPIMARAESKKDASTLPYIWMTLTSQTNEAKKGHDVALKAVELGLKINGDKDLSTLLSAAQVYAAVGDDKKFEEFSAKAIEATDNPNTKAAIENMLKSIKEKKSEIPAAKIQKPSDK